MTYKSLRSPPAVFFYKNRVDLAEVGATLSNVVVAGSCVRGCNVWDCWYVVGAVELHLNGQNFLKAKVLDTQKQCKEIVDGSIEKLFGSGRMEYPKLLMSSARRVTWRWKNRQICYSIHCNQISIISQIHKREYVGRAFGLAEKSCRILILGQDFECFFLTLSLLAEVSPNWLNIFFEMGWNLKPPSMLILLYHSWYMIHDWII